MSPEHQVFVVIDPSDDDDDADPRRCTESDVAKHLGNLSTDASREARRSNATRPAQATTPHTVDMATSASPDAGPPSPAHASPKAPHREALKQADGKFHCPVADCTDAVRAFSRKSEWNKHMDKHERPYRCPVPKCSSLPGFTYAGGLLRHEREVHSKHGASQLKVFCPHPRCKRHSGNGFSRQENLNEHLRRVHFNNVFNADFSTADDDSTDVEPLTRKRGASNAPDDLRREAKRPRTDALQGQATRLHNDDSRDNVNRPRSDDASGETQRPRNDASQENAKRARSDDAPGEAKRLRTDRLRAEIKRLRAENAALRAKVAELTGGNASSCDGLDATPAPDVHGSEQYGHTAQSRKTSHKKVLRKLAPRPDEEDMQGPLSPQPASGASDSPPDLTPPAAPSTVQGP